MHAYIRFLIRYTKTLKLGRRHIIYSLAMVILLLVGSLSLVGLSPYNEHDSDQYFRGKILAIQAVKASDIGPVQNIQLKLLDGSQRGGTITIQRADGFGDTAAKRLPIGSELLLYKDKGNGNEFGIISRWYMPGVATLFIILLTLVVVIGAWRGITSIFGLAVSITILAAFIVPRIVNGHNAFATCIEGAILITLISVYIAHGFNKRTTIAFAGSLFTLVAIAGLTGFASYVTGTSEIITEENIGILYAKPAIDVAGLLTGGIVIASLGMLFDITTGQAATVDEIHKANRKQTTAQLFLKGMSVGREHVAALINTLALVYAGVALPSIVTTVVINQQANFHPPLLVSLNTETIAEEVVRTCVASIGMLLALPITTWLAAYVLPRWTPSVNRKVRGLFSGLRASRQ